MSDREYAKAYLTRSKFGAAFYVTLVEWDAKDRKLVWLNDSKLFAKMADLKAFVAGERTSVPLMLSKPLEPAGAPVDAAPVVKRK